MMALTLGKRKRGGAATENKNTPADMDEHTTAEEDAQALFRKHFEAKFLPIAEVKRSAKQPLATRDVEEDSANEDDDSETDWEGIEEPDVPRVEVVEHTSIQQNSNMSKAELRAFMQPRPPPSRSTFTSPSAQAAISSSSNGGLARGSTATDQANLKNDLALQRLLSESHLLSSESSPFSGAGAGAGASVPSSSSYSSAPSASAIPALTGRNRHLAAELRLQRLGAPRLAALARQDRMPMAHRRGIARRAGAREAARRAEARENGVVLERATATTTTTTKGLTRRGGGTGGGGAAGGEGMVGTKRTRRRERGVGGPAVGRFVGGTLRLSRKDVSDIEGPRATRTGRSAAGGGGGGGGGSRGAGGRGGRGGGGKSGKGAKGRKR